MVAVLCHAFHHKCHVMLGGSSWVLADLVFASSFECSITMDDCRRRCSHSCLRSKFPGTHLAFTMLTHHSLLQQQVNIAEADLSHLQKGKGPLGIQTPTSRA